MTAVPALPAIPSRFGFAFSGDGRWATCLSTVQDRVTLERWALTGAAPSGRTVVAGGETADRFSRPIPLNDGGVLVARPAVGADGTPAGHGTVIAVRPDGGAAAADRTWRIAPMIAGYPLAGPGTPQTLVLVTVEDERHSRVWILPGSGARPEPVVRIPGVLSGGVWLDDGRTLALDHAAAGHRTDGIVVDLREREWRRVWTVSGTTTDRIVACDRRSARLAVTTGGPGGGAPRIGLWSPGGGRVRFPENLNRPGRARTPLAFDDGGERLLVCEDAGATSRLLIHTPADDRIEPADGPRGVLSPPASWTGGRIHLRSSVPHRPPTLATVHRTGWSLAHRPSDAAAGWAGADLVELPGPAGPIEAIVYGGARPDECDRAVLALHGGPLAAWRLEFDPLFQHLAAAGIAVVAPNQRGSTGYGERHLRAIIGDWGGPDLEDVVHLGRGLAGRRRAAGAAVPAPILLGVSYGAWLALLAACREPDLWAACVALAPFTSPASLYREAAAPVRDRVASLHRPGGTGRDARRDVLAVCGALTAPLLVAHGTRDEVVPVGQSRALRRRLLELGGTEGPGFEYLEVDGDHTAVVQAWPAALRTNVVRFCLDAGRTPASTTERR
ncbi:alpha/beta hydrolase family protein [Actinomadura algeriensis]|uniref:Pimeloyl-ACP methyl ester carboxylesterase n=1 Tax=Actinomadura algeriensis TaxID=1679523 RepID=A0ABR9K1L2_9ACTN|nr:prolyl oligopeptidase family serine peptidase [Actinomadura algeriensis]MBE1536722.1 pimeloyl-ACP methyl ester carboxylesterase [Actinomadura algeriensis]